MIDSLKCSFCLSEDDDRKYLTSDHDDSCICSNCAMMFAQYMAQNIEEGQKNDPVVSAEEHSISSYYSLRVGHCDEESEGDFIDNQDPRLSLNIAYFVDDDGNDKSLFYNPTLGLLALDGYPSDGLTEVGNKLAELTNLNPQLLVGLLMSTLQKDADGLWDVDQEYADSYFEANETDDVSDYAPCLFGIGSVTDGAGANFNYATSKIIHDGEILNNLGDLYGRIDEDETWVVGTQGYSALS